MRKLNYKNVKFLIFRNKLLKQRNKVILKEFLFPICFVILIVIFKSLIKSHIYEAEDSYIISNLKDQWKDLEKKGVDNCINFKFYKNCNISIEDRNKISLKILNEPIFKYRNFKSFICNLDSTIDENCYASSKCIEYATITFVNLYDYIINISEDYIPISDSLTGNYGLSRALPSKAISNIYLNSISYIQAAVDAAIISLSTNSSISYDINVGHLSKPPIIYSDSIEIISSFCSPITFGIITEMLQHNERNKELWIYILILTGNIINYHVMLNITSLIFKIQKFFQSKHSMDENQFYFYKQDIEKYTNFNSNCFLEVSNLSKVYKRKVLEEKRKPQTYPFLKIAKKEPFFAIKHINFKAYENEILMIVGPKGSGKSTLFKVLTGLKPASYGEINFNGTIIDKDHKRDYKNIGFCPQWNSLYDDLTVKDHIVLFAKLKELNDIDIDQILKEHDLMSINETKTKYLSESQKRKLCLAIAFIGNPKYVFLDEPTVSFDYESKKRIWNFLINKKRERIIIMTTTDINEAVVLGNRSMILNKGKVECLGSTNYIKNHFNIKYHLKIEKGLSDQTNEILSKYIHGSQIVDNHPKDQIKNSNLEKTIWELPVSSTNCFKELDRLEKIYDENRNYINHNSLYLPTLEEMYLHMNDRKPDDYDLEQNDSYGMNNDTDTDLFIDINHSKEFPKIEKPESKKKMEKMLVLLNCRYSNNLKNKKFLGYAIFFPSSIIGIIASMTVFSKYMVNYLKYSTFSTELYYSNNKIYSLPISSNNQNSTLAWNINPMNTSIPGVTDALFNNVFNTADPTYPYKITSYNDIELNDIGKTPDNRKDMDFVSSISGHIENDQYKMNVYYNESIVHALPITVNLISNSILSYNNITQKIKLYMTPEDTKINELEKNDNKDYVILNINQITILFSVTVFCSLAFFGKMITIERLNKLNHHFQLAGLSRLRFWVSTALSDSILLMLMSVVLLMYLTYKFDEIDTNRIYLKHYSYSFSTVVFQYIIYSKFKKVRSTLSFIPLFYITLTYCSVVAFTIINDIWVYYNLPNKFEIIMTVISYLFPPFSYVGVVIAGFIENLNMSSQSLNEKRSKIKRKGQFSILLSMGIYFFLLILYIDKKNYYSLPIRNRKKMKDNKNNKMINTNKDIHNECISVKRNIKSYTVCATDLTLVKKISLKSALRKLIKEEKISKGLHSLNYYISNYFTKTIIEDVTFGVNKQECFGIVGPKDSGKTCLLDMITKLISPSDGKIYFNGKNYKKCFIGDLGMSYCTQKETYFRDLKLCDQIFYELMLQGYSDKKKAKANAQQYIQYFDLEKFQDTKMYLLDDTTKRIAKFLMTICSLNDIIVLDEPTVGMDAESKEIIWKAIRQIQKNRPNTTIIMATSSMEEAQNLCDRIGILVNGRLECIGTPEELEKNYCQRFILKVESNSISDFQQKVMNESQLFGNDYIIEDEFNSWITYNVSLQKSLGTVFDVMEHYKSENLITEYSFSKLTLEQFYLSCAKYQINTSKTY